MASIIAVGKKFRAQVRRSGQPTLTKTFDSEAAATKWAEQQETAISEGNKVGSTGKTGVTLGEAIDKYVKEEATDCRTTKNVLQSLKKGMGPKLLLSKIADEHIVQYIKGKEFAPATAAVHFAFLSSVLKMAKFGWKYQVPDILTEARERLKVLGLIGKSKERDRRPTQQEIDMLLAYEWQTEMPMSDLIQFAIATAMRQAEIVRIKHATYKITEKTTVITDRKHPKKKMGNHKIVPLLDEAIEIIKRQVKHPFNDNIFPFCAGTIGEQFRKACKALGIVDLHFHDLRHEGTSRLFEMGYQIEEVQMFTGHEDWKMLKRYTHLKPQNIRRFEAPKQETKEEVKPELEAMIMDAATLEQFKMFQAMQAMMKAQAKAA